MDNIVIGNWQISAAVYIPFLYFIWISVFLLLKSIFFGKLRKFAEKTEVRFDDIFVGALDLPLLLMIFAGGVFVLDNLFEFSTGSEFLAFVNIAFKFVAIIAVIIFFDRLFKGIIDTYSEEVRVLKGAGGVIQIVVRSVVIGLGVLIVLDTLDVSITPILASLGIGSLAVALALQPTLENFFSGIQIVMDKPIAVGQFIKLESGEEGYVEKIGWRSVWVRMLANNVIVIPNKLLVSSRVLNYHYPQREMSVLVQVGVHYDSDLDHVEKVTIEVAEEVLRTVGGGVTDFKPFIRYHTFSDSSINFTTILRVKEFVDGYLIKHEFIKCLRRRYREEGIVIPYPIRTLDWNDASSPVKITDSE